jgi:prepilin-type processing-associated H-X9-DG protein
VTTVRHPINFKGASPAGATSIYSPNSLISSMHPGAANILMGDGSSRTVSDAMDSAAATTGRRSPKTSDASFHG